MKVITKDWGTQIWLNDYELLMVMKAGGETSMHKHLHHDTSIVVLSGRALDVRPDSYGEFPTSNTWIGAETEHQIVAKTDCVLYEQYTPVGPRPYSDIERLA